MNRLLSQAVRRAQVQNGPKALCTRSPRCPFGGRSLLHKVTSSCRSMRSPGTQIRSFCSQSEESSSELRTSPSVSDSSITDDHHKLFNFTVARWISRDEPLQLARHYRKFDVDALKGVLEDVACRSSTTGDRPRVVKMRKTFEGENHRILNVSFDCVQDLVVRIPLPHYDDPLHVQRHELAHPRYSPRIDHSIKSEVATMEYARSVLGVPAPRVLAWCSDASATPVQSEYIIMERAPGVPLTDVWDEMSTETKLSFVRRLWDLEEKFIKGIDGGYGSIYFREDLDPAVAKDFATDGESEQRFVLGPCTAPCFWRGVRETLDVNRGPWDDVLSYMHASSDIERQWIQKYAPAIPTETSVFDSPVHHRDPAEALKLLDMFDQLASYFVPKDANLTRPVLWPEGLNSANIFVSKESLAEGRIEITCIIDWQGVGVGPLYQQAGVPDVIRYHSPHTIPAGDTFRGRSEAFYSLSEAEQTEEMYDTLAMNLHKSYLVLSEHCRPEYSAALTMHPYMRGIQSVLSYLLESPRGGFLKLRHILIWLQNNWTDVTGEHADTCPIRFTPEILSVHAEEGRDWQETLDQFHDLCRQLRLEDDGRISIALYDIVLKICLELLDELAAGHEDPAVRKEIIRLWPFQPPPPE